MKIFLMMTVSFFLTASAVPQLPETKIILDGKADEVAWSKAALFRGMKTLGDKRPAAADGELRLFVSGGFLYGMMTAFEPDTTKLKALIKPGEEARYIQIHENDDVLNLFLAEGNRYFCQIAFNPAGVCRFSGARPTMLLYDDWRQETLREDWKLQIEYCTLVLPDRWQVEFRLKINEFEQFRSNGWRFNFCRERRAGGEELLTHFPMTGTKFNDFRQYGRLVIDGLTDPGEPGKEERGALAPAKAAAWNALAGTVRDQSGVLEAASGTKLFSVESLTVFTGQAYRLSGEFRSPEKENRPVYFGLEMLDAKNRGILPQNAQVVPGSDTQLAAATASGDSEILVKDGSKWKPDPGAFVAFDSSPDYSDLPNYRLSYTGGVREVVKEGAFWRIRLKGPHHFSGKEGTPVRLHLTGASYLYLDGKAIAAGSEWKRFSAQLSGFQQPGRPVHNRLWPGTRAVRILVWLPGKEGDGRVEFRNVKLEAL